MKYSFQKIEETKRILVREGPNFLCTTKLAQTQKSEVQELTRGAGKQKWLWLKNMYLGKLNPAQP